MGHSCRELDIKSFEEQDPHDRSHVEGDESTGATVSLKPILFDILMVINNLSFGVDPHRSSSFSSSPSKMPRYTGILFAISSISAILYHYYTSD
jgi:hypothetical protein